MQRMPGREGVLSPSRERNAMDVSENCLSVRTRLVEQQFQNMRCQRCSDGNQQCVIASTAQRLVFSSRGDPAGGRKGEQQLLVRAPSQQTRDLFRSGRGFPGGGGGN